jgi:two-component system, LytTR family, response regulator
MIKALIVDDEELARKLLKQFLSEHSDFQVLDECKDGFEALKSIKENKPDVVFLDVSMPKLSGLEMLEIMDDNPRIVFVTAYEEHAIKAFEHNAVDYLLKPFSKERFADALDKIRGQIHQQSGKIQDTYKTILERDEPLWRIVVKNRGVVKIIDVEDVYYISADDDYVFIHSKQGKDIKYATMKNFEKRLPENFMRIHRSYILNLNAIDKIESYTKETHQIRLKNGDKINSSRSGSQKLRQKLGF